MKTDNRKTAPWPLVAYGMIGASISGVTFISVPGNVMAQNFFYIPLVLGFCLGYAVVAELLLPLYYRQNLTSIYGFIATRFGNASHKTAGVAFMISRLLGAAVRVFAAIVVLNAFVPAAIRETVPAWLVVAVISAVFMLCIFLYSYRGGVHALVWTDVIQTTFMLLAVGLAIYFICRNSGLGFGGVMSAAAATQVPGYEGVCNIWNPFDWNWSHGTNVIKQLVSGVFITIAMTGLDQSMIQKSLSCKDLGAAKKNMYMTALNILLVNIFFLTLGMLLCWYVLGNGGMEALGISRTDEIFPVVARLLGPAVSVIFVIGLISACLPSAGNALVALTTSFCSDFLGSDSRRKTVMSCFAALFVIIAVVLQVISSDAVINLIYKIASYTYGPLLGIFAFGIFTTFKADDKATPWIAAASPLICLALNYLLGRFAGFDLGFTLLIVNGLLTFLGLYLFRKR